MASSQTPLKFQRVTLDDDEDIDITDAVSPLPPIDTGIGLTTAPKPAPEYTINQTSDGVKLMNMAVDNVDSSKASNLWGEAVDQKPVNGVAAATAAQGKLPGSLYWYIKKDEEDVERRFDELFMAFEKMSNANSSSLIFESNKFKISAQIMQFSVWRSRVHRMVHRHRSVGSLLDRGFISFMKRYWSAMLEELDKLDNYEEFKGVHPELYLAVENYYRLLNILWNGTDHPFPERRIKVLNEFVPCMIESIKSRFLSSPLDGCQAQADVLRAYTGLMHNLVQYTEDGLERLRQTGTAALLAKHMVTTQTSLKTKLLLILAWLVTENDSKDILETSTGKMKHLVTVLKSAIEGSGMYSKKYGYHASEMLNGLNRIASLDSNKRLIVECGALPLYVQSMSATPKKETEKCASVNQAAVEGIWTLSFDDKNAEDIKKEPGCMEALEALSKSKDEGIKKAARGALWNLGGEEKHMQHQKEEQTKAPERKKKLDHIMISYNWGVQPQVLSLRAQLKSAGFRIWIDTERMSSGQHTSTLEAMSSAVENAAIVLVCYTEKYKLSSACRAEAEYAFKLGKSIIPIRMQSRYEADGWLGMLLGTKLYYDLTREDRFTKTMADLLDAMGNVAKHGGDEVWDDEIVVMPEPEVAAHVNPIGSAAVFSPTAGPPISGGWASASRVPAVVNYQLLACAKWSETEVSEWLSTNKLQKCRIGLSGMTGELLAELCAMYGQHPDTYYKFMQEQLDLPLLEVLRLNASLRKLQE